MPRALAGLAVALLGAALAVLLVDVGAPGEDAGGPGPARDRAVAPRTPGDAVAPSLPSRSNGESPDAAPGRPRTLVIESLGVRAPVVAVEARGDVLHPPDDPTVLGWWRDGALPGAARGSAVITGHTVSTGGGAFDDLNHLRPGARVTVGTGRGTLGYVVRDVVTYRKGSFARRAPRLLSQSVPGRLVLVTCEDWNGEVYLSNQVVVATPA